MSAIDESQVRRIAHLSRLNLTDDEVRLFAGQLSSILDYVETLSELDVTGVEPMAHPLPLLNVTRPDEPGECLSNEAALANAPDSERGFFRVPEVLDQGSGA